MSDATKHERRSHFRGKPRPGRRIGVRWRPADDRVWIGSETRNIGVGGAFITTTTPVAVGHRIIIELQIPTCDRPLEVHAMVRWTGAERPGGDVGMGVQFVDVDIDILLELNDYFASLTGIEIGTPA
jgi:uncharacterized protein (TIGR02266 family)